MFSGQIIEKRRGFFCGGILLYGPPDCQVRLQILENCFKDVACSIQKGVLSAVARYAENFSRPGVGKAL